MTGDMVVGVTEPNTGASFMLVFQMVHRRTESHGSQYQLDPRLALPIEGKYSSAQ